jgi:hypothetical protein
MLRESLSSIFASYTDNWFQGISDASAVITVAQGAAALALAGVAATYAVKNSRRLRQGIFGGHTAIVGETFYTKTGKINPATGNEFVRQKLRTDKAALDMELIFHKDIRQEMLAYLVAASKHCTSESPVVFSHLKKVVPKNKYERIHSVLTLAWRNYFSEYLNQGTGAERRVLGQREDFVEDIKLPLLVWEPSTHHKQFRVLFIPKRWLEENYFPQSKDLLVQKGADLYEYDPDHHHNDRLRTNKKIIAEIESDRRYWLDNFGVGFGTGEIITISPPSP